MRFKLYALSYKALSYAEIQKDLNKEIYKENKTEKAEIGNRLRKSTNHGFRANLSQGIFASETGKNGQLRRNRGKPAEAVGRIRDRLRI